MKIFVDVDKTLGSQVYLVAADPWYEYKDSKRTDKVIGARLSLVLPLQKFDKVYVKVAGKNADEYVKAVESADSGFVPVHLINATGTVYLDSNRKQAVSLEAEDVRVVGK